MAKQQVPMGTAGSTERLPCGCLTGCGTQKAVLYDPCKTVEGQYKEAQELGRLGMTLGVDGRARLVVLQKNIRKHIGAMRGKATRERYKG